MKWIVIIAVLLMPLAVNAQKKRALYTPVSSKLKQLEIDNGYRGAHLGADTASFSDLSFDIKVNSSGKDHYYYHRMYDANQFGLAHADEITYRFVQGKLEAIVLTFTGKVNRKEALEMITALYGPGLKLEHSVLGDYKWSTEHVLLVLGDGLNAGEYTVSFERKPGKKAVSNN